ncbi:MAG: ABATE domain-containing protein [Acidobacteriia bacterium]|nr:ABATE domain-containing protein [Terriglobia bacterium]
MAKEGAPGCDAVRFGGVRTPRGYVFELTGGALCLDLPNTLDNRRAPAPRELLASYEDVVAWGVQAGAVPKATARALRQEARAHPRRAARALEQARQAREALFAVFSAVAHGRVPPVDAMEDLNAVVPHAFGSRRLDQSAGSPAWAWVEHDPPDLDRVLWPVVVSAAELLTSPGLDRVRECTGERCAWLFLDHSKNKSRRWCDMTVCGNRTKARRHYARVRSGRTGK